MAPSLIRFFDMFTLMVMLGAVPVAIAHGSGHGMEGTPGMEGTHGSHQPLADQESPPVYPPTYFSHPEHASFMYAHIALMTIAWVVILPVAVMFSLVSSRYAMALQFVFLATNAVGLLFGTVYNAQTPDLYPGNAHHSIGWIVTWVVSAQILIGLVGKVAGRFGLRRRRAPEEHHHFMPVHCQISDTLPDTHELDYRLSDDSAEAAGSRTESLRSNSVSTAYDEDGPSMPSPYKEFDDECPDLEAMPTSPQSPAMTGYTSKLQVAVSSRRLWKYVNLMYKFVDRIVLPFGFVAFATGIITYARFFEGHNVFGGLAHWIKGGVFFWLGLFNLGRWSGSFAELGWAWNAHPKQANGKWRPSAEFVESALIFFYGSTNIFLEHLGGWGGEWSAQDLEHISITVLFIGGGLCGMLIESTQVRKLLNTNIELAQVKDTYEEAGEESARLRYPESYEFSINPIPALIILLLGIMMSSHQQTTMIASMVHKQWGNLLTGASLARALTYVVLYLKPPTSIFPSRPPTELLASFGLIAGGIIFMASSSDTVDGMIHYELDAMFMYTVTMGLVGLLMAWEIFVLALNGWASRKERQACT